MGYTHGKKYSEDMIESEIKRVMETINIDRMPSRSEVESVTKSYCLTNKITRSGGWYHWADKLGLSVKESDTSKGKYYEDVCINDIFKFTGLESIKMSQNYPFDILVDGEIKVDSKVSELYQTKKGSSFHTFNLQKRFATCDIYILYCLVNGSITKRLIIPSSKCQITQLSVGLESVYDVYKERWDYFTQYSKFYKGLH